MVTIRQPILTILFVAVTSSTLTTTLVLTPSTNASTPVVVVNSDVTPSPLLKLVQCSPACVRHTEPSFIVPTIQPPKKKIPTTTNEPAPNTSSLNSRIETVIAFALAQLGKPYRWAAAGPSFYDCSGLVMTAFSRIGMKLPHFTGALIGIGRAISRGTLQRGDLVFPARGHVAIYLGNGKMVHAPQPGESIKVSAVYAFYAGRRLIS